MNSGKALVGCTLIAVGVVLLLGNAGIWDAGDVIATWWPLVLIAAGALALLGRPRALVAGSIVGLFGLAALGVTTGVLGQVGWGVVGALALMAIGAWFLFGRSGGGDVTRDERIDATFVFSGREISSRADPFRGGSLTGIFGGAELDLTGAVLEDGAVLDVVAIFGGAEITVPPQWRVLINGPAVFGGFDNGAEGADLPPDAPTLHIRALALFGGVSVKLGRVHPSRL